MRICIDDKLRFVSHLNMAILIQDILIFDQAFLESIK
jgi:hypothetical protein